jgi:flagellar protein FliO/FliZ
MRQTLQTLFGFELSSGLRWIIAFAVVLLLVALLGFFLRRMSGGRLKFKGQGGGRARQPRLGVVDVYDLDRQRQLILVRRDNVEHLVMIGGASDVVVETNIVRSGGRVAVPTPTEGLAERPLAFEAEPRPHIAEEPRPLPPSPVPAAAVPVDLVPPPRPLPPITPAPVARPSAPPQPPRPAPAPVLPAVAAGAAGISAALTRDPAPAASASELGDMARQLEEALKRPFSAVRPGASGSRTEPEAPVPTPAAPPPPPVPPAPPVAAAKPPAPTPAPARPALDMEAELEMALGLKPAPARPAASEAPLVAPPVFAPPKPPVIEPVKAEEKKPAPAKEQTPPAPAVEQAKPAKFAPVFDDMLDDELDSTKADVPEAPAGSGDKPSESKPAEPKAAADEAKPAETKSAETKAEAKPAEAKPAAKPAEDDPFSVDAIEAEFARLLGRDPKPKG